MSLLFKMYFKQQNWYEVQNGGKMEKQKNRTVIQANIKHVW